MSHIRKPIAGALILNTLICVVEALAGFSANSLSLVMDGFHNTSDEMALLFLYLACILSTNLSQKLLRLANTLNSIGLLFISGLMIWETFDRLSHPTVVAGMIPIIVGLGSSLANYGVALFLKKPSWMNAAIHLAYVHNRSDVLVSLAPVLSGILVIATHKVLFDSVTALAIALWIVWSTVTEIVQSRRELLWPEKIECVHKKENKSISSIILS